MAAGLGGRAGACVPRAARDRVTFVLFILRDATVTRQQLPRQPTTNAASVAIIGQFPWYLQDRGVHAWRGAGLDPESRLATGAGRGCDDVLESSLAGIGIRQTSGLIPDISAGAAGTLRAATS
jgi:hypothetical protein